MVTLFYRDPDGKWRPLASFPVFATDAYTPIGFGPDGTLYALEQGRRQGIAVYGQPGDRQTQ
ncbi:hypothetical protein LP420_24440 [Massilia sp. B-10]|nr:hypothetical protein LP420_24440 [Massilia sp. B-10]